MNNIKVIATMLERLDTGDGDNWHKLQAAFFLNLIKMQEKRWNRLVNDLALEAARAETYDAGEMVNVLHKKIQQEGFCTELVNPDKQNVATYMNEMLDACIDNSFRVRAALKLFFEEKVKFLECGRIPIVKNTNQKESNAKD